MKKLLSRLVAVSAVVGILALTTAAPVFSKGPPKPAADKGLWTAVTQVIEHAIVPGTHNAVCHVTANNPATSLIDPNCP